MNTLNTLHNFFKMLRAIALILIIGSIGKVFVDLYWYIDIRPIFFGKIVADPNDPKFDPMQFRFEYYNVSTGDRQHLVEAFFKMFPPGTDKKHVESILLDQAGSAVWKLKPEFDISNSYRYQWPNPQRYFGLNGLANGYIIFVQYGQDDRIIRLEFNGARLYGAETETNRKSYTADIRTQMENSLRPLRKKYLGDENGFIIKDINSEK